ncbi:MAG: 2Fe-2S iron-sulfur cluster binding domain-containing protein [Betaproteobacteria bacterium]|nr:2Fe-2S iron-sulfur cluster binding domain-containing protein [Betaproteobacteria bacterium]
MNRRADEGLSAQLGITFSVNGTQVTVRSAPAQRLAHVLREELRLTGTKIGCDAGDCGACTVLLDGQQICACLTPVGRCTGRAVRTVEGLSNGDTLSPLQAAFHHHGAAQCGICTPGMLMAAQATLEAYPHPTETQVLDGLGGVLCRCTGYRKIVDAVRDASAKHDPAPPAGQAVGARLPRLDGVAKLSGSETFGADRFPPDALWLRVIRSPHPRARFRLGDLAAFQRAYPAVQALITSADVPENSFAVFPTPKDQPVLADGVVRFRGEAVLGLLGEQAAIQRIPQSAIPILWEPLDALLSSEAALTATGDLLHDFASENVLCRGRLVKGDVATALAGSTHRAEAEFRSHHVEHAYIEPEAGYGEIVGSGDSRRLRLFVSTQTPYMDRDEVARVLRIAPERVHIVPSAIGGGFGGKLDLSVQPLLAVACWKTRRPVRLVYTRPESMVATTKRHPSRIRARLGCDANGRLTAVDFAGDFDTGAYASWGSTVANRVPVHASGPYDVHNVRALTRAVYTNNAIAGAFRGFGVPQACIATEALMDELAVACGMDRLAFRLTNALRAGGVTATGQTLHHSVGLVSCLEALRTPWQEALARCEGFNGAPTAPTAREHPLQLRGRKRRGVGVACMWYGIGNTVIANPSDMRGALRQSGRLFLYNGAQEIGQGTQTILPQIFADAVGLPVNRVDQIMGDTDHTLDAGKSSASRQTFVSGNAAKFAGEALRRALFGLLNVEEPARLRIDAQHLIAERNDQIIGSLDLRTLTTDADGNVASGQGHFDPPTVPLDDNGQGVPYATYGFAAQMAEVEVDLDYGTVQVLHVHAAHDVGCAINPTLVEGQIHGGVAQGLGMALMEEYISGRTDNLHDYLIPTVGDVPPITTYLIEAPEPLGPYGAKGVGEPALIATAPAILGAIHHATGVRVREVPCTPPRLRALLRKHES